jgi:hypothetical protein
VLSWIALVIVAALASRRVALGYSPPAPGVGYLGRIDHAVVTAAAEAIFPRGGAIERGGLDARIPWHVDQFFGAQPARNRLLMRLLFLLVEHGTILFPPPGRGRLRRFSALTREQQLAYLEGWQTSRLSSRRLVFTSLRSILTMGYFADRGVLDALGLAPRPIETPWIAADLLWPSIGAEPNAIRRDRPRPEAEG